MTAEEYKRNPREWKPEAFNFRGNKANKAFVKEIMTANNLDNEGEALDFIMQSFKQAKPLTTEQANPLTTTVADLQAKLTKTENSFNEKQKEVDYLNQMLVLNTSKYNELKKLSDSGAQYTCLESNEHFQRIKASLEKVLPKIFAERYPELAGVERVPVTDDEMLTTLCDYADRDPSKEFPFLEKSEPIILKFKATHNEQAKEEKTVSEPANTTGAAEATGNTTGNTNNAGGE